MWSMQNVHLIITLSIQDVNGNWVQARMHKIASIKQKKVSIINFPFWKWNYILNVKSKF